MSAGIDPVLAAITASAVDVTGARAGWLVAAVPDGLRVVAVAGEVAEALIGTRLEPGSGAAGFVVESGQPLALAPRGGDPRLSQGLSAALGQPPASLLCVPCESRGAATGALEVIDKAGGGSFSFDDVELATLLAGIAGVALTRSPRERPSMSSPRELQASLSALAANSPEAYEAVASLVSALIANG